MPLTIDNIVSEGLINAQYSQWGTTATTVSASTLTMTASSARIQSFTGSVAGQIVKMPDATTIAVGYEYRLLNDSSVNVTVQNNAAGALFLLGPAQSATLTCIGIGTAAGSWSYSISQSSVSGTQFQCTYPGTGLGVNYTGGNYRINGTLTAVAGGTVTCPGSTTGTIYVDVDGVVKATASIPAGATPLYNFTSTTVITVLTDVREEIENNLIWGVVGDMPTITAGQAKSAGTLEKYARADHVHGNSNILVKSGTVAAGSFAGSPKTYAVVFGTAFSAATYSIQINGVDNRSWSYQSKATTGFTINANANAALTGEVSWTAIAAGESA